MAINHSTAARCGSNNGHVAAVAYLRASSDKQETSVPDQRKAVSAYADKHGYRITDEYVDDGISGDATEKRVAFQRMIADATEGRFQSILVWDSDRFGRFDSVEAGFWIHPLRSAGVQLVSVGEGIIDWSDFTGRLMYSIRQEGKHQFLRDLARNVMRGRLAAAKAGRWMPKAPFGYRKTADLQLEIGDAEEVATVRRIFGEYLAGHSVRGICARLNGEGIRSPLGRDWQPASIASTLSNVAYAGDFRWNRERAGKYIGILGGEVAGAVEPGIADESEWIVHRDHHPALVDRETFDAVQRRLTEQRTRTTPHKRGGGFLFTGIIRCGKCGGAMSGLKTPSRVRYSCVRTKYSDSCDNNTVGQDQLTDIVLAELQRRFLSGDTLERLKAELYRQAAPTTGKDVKASRRQLETVTRKLDKAQRRLIEVDRDLLDVVQSQVRELREQRDRLQAAVEAAETPQDKRQAEIDRKVDRAFSRLWRLSETFQKADPLLQHELIQQSIRRIDVMAERDWSSRRGCYRLRSGTIHLRGDEVHNLSTTSGLP
ncbi:MAG: recombinase family protein [Planctomycetaceae bacterium]